ncbi:MAG: hypothetical protein ACI9LO_002222 [Planctomycetota bacterium]|jgi:hypothetical protein
MKLLLYLLLFFSGVVQAHDQLKVVGMNYPVWVLHNDNLVPLSPGTVIFANDILSTGRGSRALIQHPGTGTIKLGESARVRVLSVDNNKKQHYSFEVICGAFPHYPVLDQSTNQKTNVALSIGDINTELNSASIWGRSNLEKDLFCLIDGTVTVDAEGGDQQQLQQSLTVYLKPKGKAALPVDRVDTGLLQNWLAETELDSLRGVAEDRGEWQLVLLSLTSKAKAAEAVQSYEQKGFAVKRMSVIRQGKVLHRILLQGFVSIDDALSARL